MARFLRLGVAGGDQCIMRLSTTCLCRVWWMSEEDGYHIHLFSHRIQGPDQGTYSNLEAQV